MRIRPQVTTLQDPPAEVAAQRRDFAAFQTHTTSVLTALQVLPADHCLCPCEPLRLPFRKRCMSRLPFLQQHLSIRVTSSCCHHIIKHTNYNAVASAPQIFGAVALATTILITGGAPGSQLQMSQLVVQAEVRGRASWHSARHPPAGAGRGGSPTRLPTVAHPAQSAPLPSRGRSPARRSLWKQQSPPCPAGVARARINTDRQQLSLLHLAQAGGKEAFPAAPVAEIWRAQNRLAFPFATNMQLTTGIAI